MASQLVCFTRRFLQTVCLLTVCNHGKSQWKVVWNPTKVKSHKYLHYAIFQRVLIPYTKCVFRVMYDYLYRLKPKLQLFYFGKRDLQTIVAAGQWLRGQSCMTVISIFILPLLRCRYHLFCTQVDIFWSKLKKFWCLTELFHANLDNCSITRIFVVWFL